MRFTRQDAARALWEGKSSERVEADSCCFSSRRNGGKSCGRGLRACCAFRSVSPIGAATSSYTSRKKSTMKLLEQNVPKSILASQPRAPINMISPTEKHEVEKSPRTAQSGLMMLRYVLITPARN